MGRKRGRGQPAEQQAAAGGKAAAKGQVYNSTPADPPVRLLALHPQGPTAAIAFAYGRKLSIVSSGSIVDLGDRGLHENTVRALAFDPTGAWLLSADDNKTIRLWRTADWTVAHTFKVPKKPSAGAFTKDGAHAFAADKFGDVTAAATASGAVAPLLGHYCSAITALALSPDATVFLRSAPDAACITARLVDTGRFLASSDRDSKVRVSLVPVEPLQGAHEIRSYCLGHTGFVTTAAFVAGDGGAAALISGSGDGSVRAWNHLTGQQLDHLQLTHAPEAETAMEADSDAAEAAARAGGSKAAQAAAAHAAPSSEAAAMPATAAEHAAVEAELSGGAAAAAAAEDAAAEADDGEGAEAGGSGEHACPAIIALAVSPSGRFAAVAIEGQDAVQLLRVRAWAGASCGRLKASLTRLQPLTLAQVQLPTGLAFDAEDRLWVAGGALNGGAAAHLQLGVAQPQGPPLDCQRFEDATDAAVPPATREAAEAVMLSGEEAAVTAAAFEASEGITPGCCQELAGAWSHILSSAATGPARGAAKRLQGQLGQHLKKARFSVEEVQARKRDRSDVRLKAAKVAVRDIRAAAAAAAQTEAS